MGVFYFMKGDESNSFLKLLERLGAQKTPEVENSFEIIYLIIKSLSLLITAYFVYKFYQNYRQIKIEENLKGLITRIIHFKKTVNAFILISIVLLVVVTTVFIGFIFYSLNSQSIEVNTPTLTGFLIGIVLSTALTVTLVWLYYKLVYGIIMRKLDKNLKQLKDIDSQEN